MGKENLGVEAASFGYKENTWTVFNEKDILQW